MKKTKTILGAAVACAALVSVIASPASARSAHSAGCSGANLTKVETNMENMADWGNKPAVAAEIAAASTGTVERRRARLQCSHHQG